MTCVQDIVQVYSLPVLFMFILTSKGEQHMRVSHVLSAFATGLNPFLYYILDLSELLRPNYSKSLPKFGIIITRQSTDWFQMIHEDIAFVWIIDLFAEMILHNAYQ